MSFKRASFLASRIARASVTIGPRAQNAFIISQKVPIGQLGRSYATPGRPKKAIGESAPVKRTRKPATATKTTKSTKSTKSTRSTKAKVKSTKNAKAVPKKPVKKVLTQAQKERKEARIRTDKIKALKIKALKPPRSGQISAWNAYVADNYPAGSALSRMVELTSKFKQLSPADVEHYNHVARTKSESREEELRSWIESYSPKVIAEANAARRALKRMDKTTKIRGRWPVINDHRVPSRPPSSYLRFYNDRNQSGDFKDISVPDRAKLASQEWKGLSASEKSRYETESVDALRKYQADVNRLMNQ